MNIEEFTDVLSLTPEELLKILIENGFSLEDSVLQVKRHYPETGAEEMCRFVKETEKKEGGEFTKEEVAGALLKAGYSSKDVEKAVNAVYPAVSYAAVFSRSTERHAYMYAKHIPDYNFGSGDFTAEAYIKPEGAGTIFACKGISGGTGNGGFLFVYHGDGRFKFTTDDGMGFYEVLSEKQEVSDGKWHHVLAVRQDTQLYIYFDFKVCKTKVQTNRFTPLNVDNSQPFTVGTTGQVQEPYRYYTGWIDDVCLWKCAKIYHSEEEYQNTKRGKEASDLCGYWSFDEQNGADSSARQNPLTEEGTITYAAR